MKPPDVAKFEYKWQWAYHDRYQDAGAHSHLGLWFWSWSDWVFTAYAPNIILTRFNIWISLTVMRAIMESHLQPISIRKLIFVKWPKRANTGEWTMDWNRASRNSQTTQLPNIGPRESYLIYHEELESLVNIFPLWNGLDFGWPLDRSTSPIYAWFKILDASIKPILYEGKEIVLSNSSRQYCPIRVSSANTIVVKLHWLPH